MRDGKPTFGHLALALALGTGVLFWFFSLILFEGVLAGRLEIRAVPTAAASRP